ncbi:MAG: hypothetical protein ABSC06_03555 [Rhodopila sp.]
MSKSILDTLAGVVPLLEKVAPTIAIAAGGPLAATALTFLENALGLAPGAGAQPVAATLSAATPEPARRLSRRPTTILQRKWRSLIFRS